MASFVRIAHRGASGIFPENTRLAIEKAIEAHADLIELDCQLCCDGHVVMFHDERLNRTAGVAGVVNRATLGQLKQLDVGAWRRSAFKGERILTLEEVLEIVAGQAGLCLNVKQYSGSPAGIELKLLFILSHYDYLNRTLFTSGDERCLARVREFAPEARVGLVYGRESEFDPFGAAEQLRATSLHVEKNLVTCELLDRAWRLGLHAVVWTVNEIKEMEEFAALGVQGIVTDFPERFGQLIPSR